MVATLSKNLLSKTLFPLKSSFLKSLKEDQENKIILLHMKWQGILGNYFQRCPFSLRLKIWLG